MSDKSSGPFREKSLERLSSPERLDQLLQIVDRKSWLPLTALSVLAAILFGWSVFAEIPVNVHGMGILIRPRTLVVLESPGDGRLASLDIRVGQRVEAGQVLGRVALPEVEKRLALQRAKVDELVSQSLAAEILRQQRTALEQTSSKDQAKRLESYVRESRALAEQVRTRALASLDEEQGEIGEQRALTRALCDLRTRELEGQQEMFDGGMISEKALTDARQAHFESMAQMTDLDTEWRELQTRRLRVEEDYVDRLQRIADVTFELERLDVRQTELAQQNLDSETEHHRQVADARREIGRLEALIAQEGPIVAERTGVVLELSAIVGEEVEAGDRLGSIAADDPTSPLQSVAYFMVGDGKRVERDMPIQVTPVTVKRERYGGIAGTVTSVSSFPVTVAEIEAEVGNASVARTLSGGGRLMKVEARLEPDPNTPTGYAWTSSRGPRNPISAGTTTTARIAVERRAPITFVLPIFKSAAGID